MAKRVVLQNSETKRYVYGGVNTVPGGTIGSIPIFSNGGSVTGATQPFIDLPLLNIDAGDTNFLRTGNRIQMKGMHAHIRLEQELANIGNTHVRITFAWIDPNLVLSGITYGNLYLNAPTVANTTTNAFLRQGTDPDRIIRKVLFDRVYSLNTQNFPAGGTFVQQINQRLVRINIPFHNKLYQFTNAATAARGEDEDLVMFVTAFTPGFGDTDSVVQMNVSVKVYYKDP